MWTRWLSSFASKYLEGNESSENPIRFRSSNERDMRSFLDILKTTEFIMDGINYDDERRAFILYSNPFFKRKNAKRFSHALQHYFPEARLSMHSDAKDRFFIYFDPVVVYTKSVNAIVKKHSVPLFRPPDDFFSNRDKKGCEELLNHFKASSVPMDSIYLNRSDNAYYLISHAFSEAQRDRALDYCRLFKSQFDENAADLFMDYVGRTFVIVNPSGIEKQKFHDFIQDHELILFSAQQSESTGKYFTSKLKDIEQIIHELRETSYPMDSYFYDNRTNLNYIVSSDFNTKEEAEEFGKIFLRTFGESSALIRFDYEHRYYVFLDPNQVDIQTFKQFIVKHKQHFPYERQPPQDAASA